MEISSQLPSIHPSKQSSYLNYPTNDLLFCQLQCIIGCHGLSLSSRTKTGACEEKEIQVLHRDV